MKQIPVSDLIPGMVTAEDVLTYDLTILVPKGIVLTENIISRLEGYSVYYIYIHDEIADDLAKPISDLQRLQNSPSTQTNKERIHNSLQFQHFSNDYTKCAEHFRENLMKSLYHNQPLFANELVEETMQMMKQDHSDISVFDMLLNMKNHDDSVYAHCIDVALISNI